MNRSATLHLADVPCCVPLVRQPLTADAAADLARTLKAIADPARLRLLSMIAAHEGAEACVCDLTEPLGLSQPTVSHHLRVLVDAGLLTRDKRGVWAYFTLVRWTRSPMCCPVGARPRPRCKCSVGRGHVPLRWPIANAGTATMPAVSQRDCAKFTGPGPPLDAGRRRRR